MMKNYKLLFTILCFSFCSRIGKSNMFSEIDDEGNDNGKKIKKHTLKYVKGSEEWACSNCTLINTNIRQKCEVCGTQRLKKIKNANSWDCKGCTYINKKSNKKCEICNNKRVYTINGKKVTRDTIYIDFHTEDNLFDKLELRDKLKNLKNKYENIETLIFQGKNEFINLDVVYDYCEKMKGKNRICSDDIEMIKTTIIKIKKNL